MNHDEVVTGLVLELRRGTLILLTLNQLQQPKYGYSLVQELESCGVSIEGNTLYPLLRRLEGQGLLTSQWETGGAKPRKYYRITEDGAVVLEKTKEHWRKFSANVTNLLEETGHETK